MQKLHENMLVKLTPGVNFTNILHKAFTRADPKSAKKTEEGLNVFFVLLGSTHIKAACKMKLTPGDNPIKGI